MLRVSPICSHGKHASTCHFCLFYAVLTESFSKRLVGPRTRTVYQQTNLLSLAPSVSWFSWTDEYPLFLFLRFTFAIVAGFCLLICLIPQHSCLSNWVSLYLVLRKRRIKIWNTGKTAVRSDTCGPPSPSYRHCFSPLLARATNAILQGFFHCFLSRPIFITTLFQIHWFSTLEVLLYHPLLCGVAELNPASEKPFAAFGDGHKINKD